MLLNAILCMREYPSELAEALLKKENVPILVHEIEKSGKIWNLVTLRNLAKCIYAYPLRDKEGRSGRKDPLYAALTRKLMEFIKARKGYGRWDRRTAESFRAVIGGLPQRYRSQLLRFLEKEKASLMVSQLDRLTRYRIYLKDISQWEVCTALEQELG